MNVRIYPSSYFGPKIVNHMRNIELRVCCSADGKSLIFLIVRTYVSDQSMYDPSILSL